MRQIVLVVAVIAIYLASSNKLGALIDSIAENVAASRG